MYYNSSPLASEPGFSNYASYYLTWYDSSYSNLGPYGEPLPSPEELDNESSPEEYWKAEDDVSSRSWYNNELNGKGYNSEVSYTGGGNWLGEFESYLAGRWGEDITSYGYDTSEKVSEPYTSGLEKSQSLNASEESYSSYYSYNDEMQTAYARNEHFAYDSNLEDTIEEDVFYHGWPETQSDDVWDERRICESIFGHWPSRLQLDQESRVEEA